MVSLPYELPRGWACAKLSEIVQELESGGRPKGGVRGISSGIPSIGGEHLSDDGAFDFRSIRFVPNSFAVSMRRGRIKLQDILIVKDGATTGKTSFVGDDFPYKEAVLNEHVFRLRVFPEVAIQRYIFHFLRGDLGQKMMQESFRGSTQGGINQSFPELIHVPLAPLPEQERVVSKLEAALSRISSARRAFGRVPPIFKALRQSILAKTFRGELTERDPDDEPAERLLERIRQERWKKWEEDLRVKGKNPKKYKYEEPSLVNTEGLPALPDGWTWCRVESIAEVRLGRQRSPKNRPNKYPRKYLRAANIVETGFDLSDVKEMEFKPKEFETYRLRSGDILLSEGSGSPYEVGKCAVWEGNIPDCCIQNTVIRVRSQYIPPRYLFYAFKHARYKRDFAKMAKGIEIAHLGAERLAAYRIPLAPKSEQLRLVKKLDYLLTSAEEGERAIKIAARESEHLEQSILGYAFRGRLAPQDPSDEPASALLKKVKSQRVVLTGKGKSQVLLELVRPAKITPKA